MFTGHFATGLILYTLIDPDTKKGYEKSIFFIMVLATQFVDVLWGIFTIIGLEGGVSGGNVEYNYFDVRWSHSLLMMIIWSVIYGLSCQQYYRNKIGDTTKLSLIAGFGVFSHWVLDFIVHNDDMLLFPVSDITVPSLYLWEYPIITFILETAIIVVSWVYYYQKLQNNYDISSLTKPVGLGIVLILFHIVNFFPSLGDNEGMSSNPVSGIVAMVGILIIVLMMTWLHSTKMVETEE